MVGPTITVRSLRVCRAQPSCNCSVSLSCQCHELITCRHMMWRLFLSREAPLVTSCCVEWSLGTRSGEPGRLAGHDANRALSAPRSSRSDACNPCAVGTTGVHCRSAIGLSIGKSQMAVIGSRIELPRGTLRSCHRTDISASCVTGPATTRHHFSRCVQRTKATEMPRAK